MQKAEGKMLDQEVVIPKKSLREGDVYQFVIFLKRNITNCLN